MKVKILKDNKLQEYTVEEALKVLYEMGKEDKENGRKARTRKNIFQHEFGPVNRDMSGQETVMNILFLRGYITGWFAGKKQQK